MCVSPPCNRVVAFPQEDSGRLSEVGIALLQVTTLLSCLATTFFCSEYCNAQPIACSPFVSISSLIQVFVPQCAQGTWSLIQWRLTQSHGISVRQWKREIDIECCVRNFCCERIETFTLTFPQLKDDGRCMTTKECSCSNCGGFQKCHRVIVWIKAKP